MTGNAEFRSKVTVRRDGEPAATVEPARDGAFAAAVQLREGLNSLTAVAANYAGESPASAPVAITLDTTGPTMSWTPNDRDGFFATTTTVRGSVSDVHAGVAEVLVNGRAAALAANGAFTAEVALEEGVNQLTVMARDRVGNETTETRAVRSFRYRPEWEVAGGTGNGRLNVFLRVLDPRAGSGIQVDSARAELVRADGSVAAAATMRWQADERRYKGDLGKPAGGSYSLRGVLVVEGWNVVAAGPAVVRPSGAAEPALTGVDAGDG